MACGLLPLDREVENALGNFPVGCAVCGRSAGKLRVGPDSMDTVKDFRGRVAAITGAGSGIGQALSIDLARRGTHLALSDIDAAGLAETVGRCEGHDVKVTSALLDVANRVAVHAWADEVVDRYGAVNLIVNNAGVALAATVDGTEFDDFEWLMDINFWGVVNGTKAFLPHLEASGEGHVVNISSVFGLIGIPGQSAYNSAKFAVRGFTDALRVELDMADSCVSATTVHPGGIKTNIARSARVHDSAADLSSDDGDFVEEFDKLALTTPEKAAKQILKAVERDRRRCLVGPDAKVFDLMSRLPAGVVQRLLARGSNRRTT